MSDLQRRGVLFALLVIVALVFLGPTVKPELFGEKWISKPISLGLDLSGGVHLEYEVKTKEAVTSRLQATLTSIRGELREQKIAVARAKVNQAQQIELVLLSDLSLEKTKELIAQNRKELALVEVRREADKPLLVYTIPEMSAARIETEAVGQAIEILRSRVDQFGVAEPLIQKVGVNRILLQMPGVQDIVAVKKVVGSVARLDFRLVATGPMGPNRISLKTRDGGVEVLEDEILMGGDAVASAAVSVDSGQVEVMLNLTTDGGRTFRRLTTENVGRQLAIILDNVVYSSPVIREPITGGKATISGGFTIQEARQLAVVLRAALPAPLEVLVERTVGPTLGAESIRSGVMAIAIGFSLIVVYLVVYYKKSGLVAVASLALNILLCVAALSAFGATLTLPGLAGLALTVGMAVDSNVIIFERIREEIKGGASRDAAVVAGFDRALSAIMDSNITTLLAAAILYWIGSGPIRGFAVTLGIGVATTLYCATVASKLAFDYFRLEGEKNLSI